METFIYSIFLNIVGLNNTLESREKANPFRYKPTTELTKQFKNNT